MAISLRPEHLKRYKDMALVLMKYGRADLVRSAGLEEAIEGTQDVQVSPAKMEELAADLEKMGPTFIKLAQLLSTRADLLPQPYIDALARLQDKVEPFPFTEVEQIVADELGVRISKAFSRFDREPIAAASLGQVHRAALRDGREVVVKVQRPGIREQIVEGHGRARRHVATSSTTHTEAGRKYEFTPLRSKSSARPSCASWTTGSRRATSSSSPTTCATSTASSSRGPSRTYTTSRVLTMDYVSGREDHDALRRSRRSTSTATALAEHLFRAYLQQILVDGFFHADPHPGNVFLTDDGRVALIDLGMVARITPRFQESLLQLLLAISEGKGDDAADLAIKMGEAKPGFDEKTFRRHVADLVSQNQNAQL